MVRSLNPLRAEPDLAPVPVPEVIEPPEPASHEDLYREAVQLIDAGWRTGRTSERQQRRLSVLAGELGAGAIQKIEEQGLVRHAEALTDEQRRRAPELLRERAEREQSFLPPNGKKAARDAWRGHARLTAALGTLAAQEDQAILAAVTSIRREFAERRAQLSRQMQEERR